MKKILTEYFHKIYWEKKGKIYKLKAEYITGVVETAAMVGTKNRKIQVLLFNVSTNPKERLAADQKFRTITEAKKYAEEILEKDLSDDRFHKRLWS